MINDINKKMRENKSNKKNKINNQFTIIEFLFSVIIVLILQLIAIWVYLDQQKKDYELEKNVVKKEQILNGNKNIS